VEILSIPGCPNRQRARALVERAAAGLGIEPDLGVVQVGPEDVERLRFLGSPTVRVNGHDVEPGADARDSHAYGCRVYETAHGPAGVPDEEWLRAALHAAARLG
jgi:hypothetical protein